MQSVFYFLLQLLLLLSIFREVRQVITKDCETETVPSSYTGSCCFVLICHNFIIAHTQLNSTQCTVRFCQWHNSTNHASFQVEHQITARIRTDSDCCYLFRIEYYTRPHMYMNDTF